MNEKKTRTRWTTSQRLQFAAFMVAAPRYMAMGAMAIGIKLTGIHWIFAAIEIASWVGFAILEGYAIPYIAKGIRRFEKRTFEWYQLTVYRVLLLLAIPVLGAPLYLAISAGRLISDVMSTAGFVIWSFILCGIGAVIIDAVGTVETVNEPEVVSLIPTRSPRIERVGVEDRAKFLAGYYHEMTPDAFATVFKEETGLDLTSAEASAALVAARPAPAEAKPGRSGRRNGAGGGG